MVASVLLRAARDFAASHPVAFTAATRLGQSVVIPITCCISTYELTARLVMASCSNKCATPARGKMHRHHGSSTSV